MLTPRAMEVDMAAPSAPMAGRPNLPKSQGIVSDDVHHIDQHRNQHGVNGFVGTTQGRGNSQRNSLEKTQTHLQISM